MAYKPKAPPVMAAPNVIPMADIMLVLLIIFMVITPMLQKGVTVDMAKAENADKMPNADKDDAIIVAVTRDGKTLPGQHAKSASIEITNEVKDQLSDRLDKTVYVRSDRAREVWRRRQGCGRSPLRRRGESRPSHREDPAKANCSAATSAGRLRTSAATVQQS